MLCTWHPDWPQSSCSEGGAITGHLAAQEYARLVGVRDKQGALRRAVVIEHVHDLHRRVCLARAWRANHHGQPWLHARPDRLHLTAQRTMSQKGAGDALRKS